MSTTEMAPGRSASPERHTGGPAGPESRGAAAVHASPAALEVLGHLVAAHGPLVMFQSGGSCDGTHPLCLRQDELPLGPNDVCLGELGSVPFYVDRDQYERLGRPSFEVDVAPGGEDGFSLESAAGVRFVSRTPPRSRTSSAGPWSSAGARSGAPASAGRRSRAGARSGRSL